jgi:hypothetical protein
LIAEKEILGGVVLSAYDACVIAKRAHAIAIIIPFFINVYPDVNIIC